MKASKRRFCKWALNSYNYIKEENGKTEMKLKQDLTNGNVTKAMLLFATPMILGNLLQQLYNIVDTWVVGQFVGADALASVGAAYSLMTFLTSIIIGLCMGSGALLSYYSGKADEEGFQSCMRSAFILIGWIAVSISILVQLLLDPILHFLRIPPELYAMMRDYVFIVFMGILFVFLYNYFAFLLRAVGNSVVPLWFLAVSSVMNVILDILFVVGFSWGLQGAAVATVLSQAVSGVGLWIYTRRKEPRLCFPLRGGAGGGQIMGKILRFSLITSAQQSVMNFGILLVQGLVNSFGPSVMAAFAAAVKVDTFAYMPAQEFGNAFSIFISQNYGAKKTERIKKGTVSACMVSFAFCLLVSGIVFGMAKYLMLIFVKAEEVEIIRIGVEYLRIEGAFYVGIGILFLLYGYFRGMNRPSISLLLTVISLGTRVVLAYSLAAVPKIGATGIWWAIPVGWALADLTGGVLLCRQRVTKGTDSETVS